MFVIKDGSLGDDPYPNRIKPQYLRQGGIYLHLTLNGPGFLKVGFGKATTFLALRYSHNYGLELKVI